MRFSIPHDHPCLAGHFPGHPVVPGVVVLDQVLAALEARSGITTPLRLPQVKFVAPLLPGEEAGVTLEGDGARWRFRVTRGGDVIATGEVVAA